ncbi:unannotated protein [freshwater metagenome]|uniref:Unannotated protein n=1 Tax=freshwater metagenome TaxID=449393 RepID=A0A6J7APP5_9ZZZZ
MVPGVSLVPPLWLILGTRRRRQIDELIGVVSDVWSDATPLVFLDYLRDLATGDSVVRTFPK